MSMATLEPVRQMTPEGSPPTASTINPSNINLDVNNPPMISPLPPHNVSIDVNNPPIIAPIAAPALAVNIVKDLKAIKELGRQERIEAAKKKESKAKT